MFIHSKLVALVLVLTLGQVHTGTIIGGHEAQPHSRPYMVIVERSVKGKGTIFCDGFLLNEDFVMSAAHCQADVYTVLLGVHDTRNNRETQRIKVDQSFPHKDYNSTVYKNDVMLLKLSSKAKFNDNVRPIDLAGQDDGSLPKSCIVSGWGTTSMNNKYLSTKLMEVNVTLINISECHQEDSYCSEGEVGPNSGDSGGPLVCEDGKAYGVISSILKDSSGRLIHRYAKIPDKRGWITSTMNNVLL